MGNRFLGGIAPGAMPPLHRYLGNPVLTAIGRLFFRSPCGDFHCGLRGFSARRSSALDLQAPGMEFASEMVVKATIQPAAHHRGADHAVARRPLAPAAPAELARRLAAPALPAAVQPALAVPLPGLALFLARPGVMAWLLPAPRTVGGVTLDIHTLFYAALAVVVGFQSMLFWVFTKIYGMREGIVPPDPRFNAMMRLVTLELGLIVGGVLLLCGLASRHLRAWRMGQRGVRRAVARAGDAPGHSVRARRSCWRSRSPMGHSS